MSHAHFDHIQDVSFLDPCIPAYCTEKTKVLAKAMTDVSVSGVDDQYYKIAKKATIKLKPQLFKTLCPGECACNEEKEEEHLIVEDPKTKFKFTYDIAPQNRTFNTAYEGQIKGHQVQVDSCRAFSYRVPAQCFSPFHMANGFFTLEMLGFMVRVRFRLRIMCAQLMVLLMF